MIFVAGQRAASPGLSEALARNRPFRNFKDCLAEYPNVFRRFSNYKDRRLLAKLKDDLDWAGYELVFDGEE